MNLGRKCSLAIQMLAASLMVAALAAACGGGSSGFTQTYISSAGVGEVLQFTVDTANMVYTYTVSHTSYAASGVVAGQTGAGSLVSRNSNGSFDLGPSNDGFISGGRLLPMQNGLLAGHVQINAVGGANNIPVFGVSNPIVSVAALAGTYTYQGFSCSALGIANVYGNTACVSRIGTITVTSSGAYTLCKGGDINTSPGANACKALATGTVNALASPGVFDFTNASGHIGWLFAFAAPGGQTVAVIDHDDSLSATHEYGHSVLSTYASMVLGATDGNYFVNNNEGGESLVIVSGVNVTSTAISGVTGTLTLNSPWPGLSFFQFASGVVATSGETTIAGTKVYTYTENADPAVFGAGIRYAP